MLVCNFRGTIIALWLPGTLALVAFIQAPDDLHLDSRWFLHSDNKFVGHGSPLECACRAIPVVHEWGWHDSFHCRPGIKRLPLP